MMGKRTLSMPRSRGYHGVRRVRLAEGLVKEQADRFIGLAFSASLKEIAQKSINDTVVLGFIDNFIPDLRSSGNEPSVRYFTMSASSGHSDCKWNKVFLFCNI